jgi:hypothetical protein
VIIVIVKVANMARILMIGTHKPLMENGFVMFAINTKFAKPSQKEKERDLVMANVIIDRN